MNQEHQELFIVDIETIPDITIGENLLGKTYGKKKTIEEKRKALEAYHLEITDGKNPFLRQLFHQVIAISFVRASIMRDDHGNEFYTLKEIRSGGSKESSEAELIEGFFKTIEKRKARLITFNGRTFDIPVLKYRAMKYGIQAAFFHKAGDKWNSYQARYASNWHCDLLDVLSDYGASARIKLNEVCAILGYPGKLGIDGSDVASLYDKGEIETIRQYCETDVLNTYLVYLSYSHHIGSITDNGRESALNDVRTYLKRQTKETHWKEFQEQWDKSTMTIAPSFSKNEKN